MEYGMSRLGRVNYRESNRSPFLAMASGEESVRHAASRRPARSTRKSSGSSTNRSRRCGTSWTFAALALEALTKELIEVESIDANELKRIIDENSPGPLVVPGTEAALRLAAAEAAETPASGATEKSG